MNLTRKLINGSAEEILPELIRQGVQIDLILTDPPYNLKKDFGNDSDSLPLDEFLEISRSRIELCAKLLAPEGSLLWFGIHNYIGYLQTIMYDVGLHYRRMNIWHYRNGFSRSKKAPRTEYEPFLWFSKSAKRWTYNVDDVRVPYRSESRLKNPVWYRDSSGNRKQWEPDPRGAMRGDVWDYPTLAGKRFQAERTEHPTQKPESLFLDLVRAYCPKDNDGRYSGTVLDPFVGSGTTAVVCERLNAEGHNINWLGIELEKRWIQVAESRIHALKPSNHLF